MTGPLAQYVDRFRTELDRLGYTPLTAAGHLRLVAHLSRWLVAAGLDTSALTSSTVERYFAERHSGRYVNERTVRSLRPLLDYLGRVGTAPIPVSASPRSATEQLLAHYREYLTVERGLAATTADLNVRLVRSFLSRHASDRESRVDLEQLSGRDVAAFVVEQSTRRYRSVKRLVTALRSLLGFLYVERLIDQPLTPESSCVSRVCQAAARPWDLPHQARIATDATALRWRCPKVASATFRSVSAGRARPSSWRTTRSSGRRPGRSPAAVKPWPISRL